MDEREYWYQTLPVENRLSGSLLTSGDVDALTQWVSGYLLLL